MLTRNQLSAFDKGYLYVLSNEIQGHSVLCPAGDYHISVFLGWDAELLKCRFDEAGVLVEDVLENKATMKGWADFFFIMTIC